MTLPKRWLVLLSLLCVTVHGSAQVTGSGTATTPAASEKTTTAALVAEAAVSFPACGYWHSSGLCFFLVCGWGCHIKTSPRVSHFNPDLVVSTFHDLDNHPWVEIGIPIGQAAIHTSSLLYQALIGDSAGSRFKSKRDDKNERFRDGDAIGHPGGFAASSLFSSTGMLCSNNTTPFYPYYSSFTDAMMWRNFLPLELVYPQSLIPGLREIGSWPLNTWGNVFPRSGWTTQQHDVKASAVLSQRIADFVTRSGEPHLYNKVDSSGIHSRDGQIVWDPPPAEENSLLGGIWQISAPFRSPTCNVFGYNDSVSPVSYGDFQTAASGSYSFTLWRPYACCKKKGIFLYAITWGMW